MHSTVGAGCLGVGLVAVGYVLSFDVDHNIYAPFYGIAVAIWSRFLCVCVCVHVFACLRVFVCVCIYVHSVDMNHNIYAPFYGIAAAISSRSS